LSSKTFEILIFGVKWMELLSFDIDIADVFELKAGEDIEKYACSIVDENKMPTQPGAINGGLMKRTEQVKGPVIAVQVDSVDTYLEKVLAKGGKLIMPKMEIPNMGYYAYVADPEDNVFGLWEPIAP